MGTLLYLLAANNSECPAKHKHYSLIIWCSSADCYRAERERQCQVAQRTSATKTNLWVTSLPQHESTSLVFPHLCHVYTIYWYLLLLFLSFIQTKGSWWLKMKILLLNNCQRMVNGFYSSVSHLSILSIHYLVSPNLTRPRLAFCNPQWTLRSVFSAFCTMSEMHQKSCFKMQINYHSEICDTVGLNSAWCKRSFEWLAGKKWMWTWSLLPKRKSDHDFEHLIPVCVDCHFTSFQFTSPH